MNGKLIDEILNTTERVLTIRNRLLRITADSPDLLAIIKAVGNV
jgi:hypothetical protein